MSLRVLLLAALTFGISPGEPAAEPLVVGELVCQMAEGESIELVNSHFGSVTAQFLPILNIYQLNFMGSEDLATISAEIEALPEVIFCHPNYLIEPLQTVQGSLPISDVATRNDYLTQPAISQLKVEAIQMITTGSGVKVGILDGGAHLQHPEFAGTVVSGYDYVNDDAMALDDLGGPNSGHGTFVAGVVKLLAPEAEIRVYRVTDINGESNGYIVAEAIMRAVGEGCQVINLSMVTEQEHKAIREALQHARDNNVLVVAAAGNGYSSDEHYPASDINSLGVAAVDASNDLAEFSSYGDHVDVCAPGVQICSPYVEDKYAWWEGTSFAAPFVTAQAALIYSLFPSVEVDEVKDIIIVTADNIDSNNPGREGMLGAGLMNPLASLSSGLCGDVSGNGRVSGIDMDVLYYNLYFPKYWSAVWPVDFSVADVDDWEGITPNDFQTMMVQEYGSGAVYDCEPDNSGPFPVSTDHTIEVRGSTIPPNQSEWVIEFWMTADSEYDAVAFPFSIGYTGLSFAIDSLEINYLDSVWFRPTDQIDTNIVTGAITGLFARHNFSEATPAGEYLLASLYLSDVYSNDSQVVIIDTLSRAPGVSPMVSTNGYLAPLIPEIVGLGGEVDLDNDGIGQTLDNCPAVANAGQEDEDLDGVGDACDVCPGSDDLADFDYDYYPDDCDNCSQVRNEDQSDIDGDGVGDVCDGCPTSVDTVDTDSDGVHDDCDNCPDLAGIDQTDRDGDGIGDICDDCVDVDGDGLGDPAFPWLTCPPDNCPEVSNLDQIDSDGDGLGDDCDNCPDVVSDNTNDYDTDGLGDICDNCLERYNPDQADSSGDGVGDVCEDEFYYCGNVTGDIRNYVDLSDRGALIAYLNGDGPEPMPGSADMDNWSGITFNDVAALMAYIYDYIPLDCAPDNFDPFPQSQADTLEVLDRVIPARVDEWTVELMITASDVWSGISLPFSFGCSNPSVVIDSIQVEGIFDMWFKLRNLDGAESDVIITRPSSSREYESGKRKLAIIHLGNTYSPDEHLVRFDTLGFYPPSNVPVLSLDYGRNPVVPVMIGLASSTDTDSDGISDALDNCFQSANPDQIDSDGDGLGDVCDCLCGQLTDGYSGNTDCDTEGLRNLVDITTLIDRVYVSKGLLCCEREGNVDGDIESKLNLSDITALIDHVYVTKNETAVCE